MYIIYCMSAPSELWTLKVNPYDSRAFLELGARGKPYHPLYGPHGNGKGFCTVWGPWTWKTLFVFPSHIKVAFPYTTLPWGFDLKSYATSDQTWKSYPQPIDMIFRTRIPNYENYDNQNHFLHTHTVIPMQIKDKWIMKQ